MTSVPPAVIAAVAVPFAGAVATVGILAYQNRREISRMKDWAWGPERSDNKGHEGEVDSLSNQMDRIETKIDRDREQRAEDHRDVANKIKTNRYLTIASVSGIVEAINTEVDEIDLDESDVRPEWIDEDELDVDLFDDDDRPPWQGRPTSDDD